MTMNANEARRVFLDYFVDKGHVELPSSSVVPHGDNTLLFTNAGMNQFKEIFTGKDTPVARGVPGKRATTAQKCIRAGGKHNDLDNVGYTSRHLTFFEMLGNFSFGDYFKTDAISFAWELVTDRFGISPDRLWITVYEEDDEARDLWLKVAGVRPDRVVGLGKKDNYWSMGDVGPCGPCSEILVDRGDAFGAQDIENGERFFEIWNLVFMQLEQQADGATVPLPHPSIDTGMGLERLLMVLQGVDNAFETDILRGLIGKVEEISGVKYDPGPDGVPHRVIADHVRSLAFALADGAEPSNEGRGYVLRRILRRAARYGRKIFPDGSVVSHLVGELVGEMGTAFPELVKSQDFITKVIRNEEERFGETLDKGIQLFEETTSHLRGAGKTLIPGADVFKLYDTFGFPVDLVEQMAGESGFEVDSDGFEQHMAAQKKRSRGASQFRVQTDEASGLDPSQFPETLFVGYDESQADSEIVGAVRDGDTWQVVLARTPFYAEGGGQVGDTGFLCSGNVRLEVAGTQKKSGRFVHLCRLLEGDPEAVVPGAQIEARVDSERRVEIQRNHTATHLLHAALREVLGTHVRQKGSLVERVRLRFDVTHFSGIEPAEIAAAEDIVRRQILADTPVETFESSYDEAVERGAMALFGEKYGDVVRVVQIGDFSTELCGGTHVARTGEIGPFLVTAEGSVSSGVRRLEALTGLGADDRNRTRGEILDGVGRLLKTRPEAALERLQKLLEENRELKSQAKAASAASPATGQAVERRQIGEAVLASAVLEKGSADDLRATFDELKKEAPASVVVVFSRSGKGLRILVGVTASLVQRGLDAREIFRAASESVAAKGGGRPELAQGGGSDRPGGIEAALEAMASTVKSALDGS